MLLTLTPASAAGPDARDAIRRHEAAGGRLAVTASQDFVFDEASGVAAAVVTAMGAPADPDRSRADDRGRARNLAACFREQGERAFESLSGPFRACVADLRNGRILAAVDRLGHHQLWFTSGTDYCGVASRPANLAARDPGGAVIDPQALYEYLYFHMLPSPRSAWRGIGKLDNGHLFDYRDGHATTRRYWMPDFSRDNAASPAELQQQLLDELGGAVETMSADGPCGAFLSGGLDSSTVVGMLARGGEAHAFSIGFEEQAYNELPYARISAEHFGATLHELVLKPADVAEALPDIVAALYEPFGNSSVVPAYYCARLARETGLAVMLAGDGGDEIFAGNERYQKQLLFEHFGKVPGALRSGLVEPLAGAAGALPVWPFTKFASYVAQARIPLPDRMETYNFLHQNAPGEVFDPAFLDKVDTGAPAALLQSVYASPDHGSALDRMLFLDWKRTLHDNDLVKVARMCALAGMEVRFPFLTDGMVALANRVPADQKIRRGELRWFFKQAMRGFLPDATLTKQKHGFGLPFGVWLRTDPALQELASDALGTLGERGIFLPSFISEAQRRHRDDHAAYYGELVWILMLLELWLRQNA